MIRRSVRTIVWSRLLTHSGDQAWDFAVPLALVAVFPANLEVVALYYLLVRCAHMLLVARVCAWMDRWNRLRAIRLGIGVQTVGVILAVGGIHALLGAAGAGVWASPESAMAFGLVLLAGLLASLGSSMMDIAVSQDWIPTIVPADELAAVNSRLRQVDLFTEVAAPVVAGLILAVRTEAAPLLGFGCVAAWNIVSFVPEYRLLRRVYDAESHLASKAAEIAVPKATSLLRSLAGGWRDFFAQPAALSILAYAFLWMTVLSPHGVLLTAWLRTEWGLSEASVGLFRGLGAIFGLLATVAFPRVLARLGLVKATQAFIVWEAVCLVLAGVAFWNGKDYALLFSLGILLSRVGLYGFSLGEVEIRQRSIPPAVRGRVNGFANALTSLATLGVYGAGALLKDPSDFSKLVYGSIAFVCVGAGTFALWASTQTAVAPASRN